MLKGVLLGAMVILHFANKIVSLHQRWDNGSLFLQVKYFKKNLYEKAMLRLRLSYFWTFCT
jgi:hypothetical protein